MSTSTAMTEIPDSRKQLHDAFMSMALRSFKLSEEARRKVDFYGAVLRKLDRGESIEDEVPEAKGMMPEVVRLTVQRLLRTNQVLADEAWELAESYKSCFVTTVRSVLPKEEMIPQYDVQYVGQSEAGDTKISVKTFRRNIEVEVQGSAGALDQLWGQVSLAALMAG